MGWRPYTCKYLKSPGTLINSLREQKESRVLLSTKECLYVISTEKCRRNQLFGKVWRREKIGGLENNENMILFHYSLDHQIEQL